MLDLVKKEAADISATFLEPACGNGNFLAEILSRKLKTAEHLCCGDPFAYEHFALQAMASIYGVDIQPDNVQEARDRLFDNYFARHVRLFNRQPNPAYTSAMRFVLEKNIQCGNTLTCSSADGSPLFISEWAFDSDGTVQRKVYSYRAMVETRCDVGAVKVYPRIHPMWIANENMIRR